MKSQCSRFLALVGIGFSILAFTADAAEPPLSVYAVNYPLAYFAERIGGESVDVRFPAPDNIDPAFWKPSAETIVKFQAADLILQNGAGYARWMGQASLPRRKLVDTSRSFEALYLSTESGPLHQHGPSGEHVHGEIAFTTWLDPKLAIEQARAIQSALAKRLPDEAHELAARADALVGDLEEIDRSFAAAFAALGGGSLLASHPIYAYLGRRYELDIQSFVWEPDAFPVESEWHALDQVRSASLPRWMLWEAGPLESTRAALEQRGIGIIVFEAYGNRPSRGDLLDGLHRNLDAIRRAAVSDH